MKIEEIIDMPEYDARVAALETVSDAEICAEYECDPECAWVVRDAIANGDDVEDHLEEFSYWRSPQGRQDDFAEAFESGRPMSSDDY